ncbi:FtsW/RodA/SpoVE family cell cycle protein [Leifsonia shinshuensis]|uniref:Cell division protein FtsW (Lipid II flippase) n=1 Tax=Leifsonia shinshuensis TaxID=150026 RepID=A0A853CQR1_9MICO|nr:cell division protein FtsW (lipid II flippase) [Leifsonia shinshuensis]
MTALRSPGARTATRLRNVELLLLLTAGAVSLAAVALVQLGALGRIEAGFLQLSAIPLVLAFAMHLTMRFVTPTADPFFLPIMTALSGLGIAEIYRIDLHYGYSGWGSTSVRQIVWCAIAIVCAILTLVVIRNVQVLNRYTYTVGLVAFALLLLPLLPGIGKTVSGARAWIGIGAFSFQPGELAKIALAAFFAGYLMRHRDALSLLGHRFLGMRFPRVRHLGPVVLVWLLSILVVILQHDLGPGLLYFGIFLIVIYVATGRIGWLAIGGVLIVLGGAAANAALTYVHLRFANWLTPFDQHVYDADGGSFQLVQGLFGIAHGGVIGTGLGQGQPWVTPVSQSDYIFASLGEELGLAGLFAIICLYLLFTFRGLRIGFDSADDFGALLAVGLSFGVALQAFIIIGGVTRVIPLTGLTTPFLAAGGSSLIANWIIGALLLRLSSVCRLPQRLQGVGAAS